MVKAEDSRSSDKGFQSCRQKINVAKDNKVRIKCDGALMGRGLGAVDEVI